MVKRKLKSPAYVKPLLAKKPTVPEPPELSGSEQPTLKKYSIDMTFGKLNKINGWLSWLLTNAGPEDTREIFFFLRF